MRKAIQCVLLAGLSVVACREDFRGDYLAYQPDDVFILELSPISAPADGATSVRVVVELLRKDADVKEVKVSAPGLSFVGGTASTTTISADRNGLATAILSPSKQTGKSMVTATVLSYQQTDTVTYTHAYPDSIVVDPGAFSLKAASDKETTVVALLLRNMGVTSVGTGVTFSAVDSGGAEIGAWRGQTSSDAAGKATAKFWVGDNPYRGEVEIRADAPAGQGTVRGVAKLEIVAP